MKKIALLLTLILAVGMLTACGSANNTSSDSGTTPKAEQPTNTPTEAAPTNTPTPSPTPTPDPNTFFKSDFDSDFVGLLLDDVNEEVAAAVKGDGKLVYLMFDQVGNGMATISEDQGVNGSACLVATGRTAAWNGIAITMHQKWYGKGFKVSFDAKCTSLKDGITDMLVSLTTKFEILKEDGSTHSMQYPAYNRVTGVSQNGEWVHCESVIYLPSNIYLDPDTQTSNAQIYFECADGKGKEDIYIDNLEIIATDGIGDYEAFNAYWEEHKPEEEGEGE